MKTEPCGLAVAILITGMVFPGSESFGQPGISSRGAPPHIDPATALPAAPGGTATINPATGLPSSSGASPVIDPSTGLPVGTFSAGGDAKAGMRAVRTSPPTMPAPIPVQPVMVERSDLFGAGVRSPYASAEHWAPALTPSTKPDVAAVLHEAKDLAEGGQYEAALQRHLWYHNHALEYEPEAQRGVRLSFALSYWAALGRKYPKAREALQEIRDRDLHEFAVGRGSADLFKDIAAINDQWDHYRTTCRLFHYVRDQDPQLAKRCYALAETALVKNGEYELCFGFVGDGQEKFDHIRADWERLGKWENQMASVRQESQKKMEQYRAEQGRQGPNIVMPPGPPRAADNIMIKKTRQLIEILVGAGHKGDAERVQEQALALLEEASLQSAVADAEKKLAR